MNFDAVRDRVAARHAEALQREALLREAIFGLDWLKRFWGWLTKPVTDKGKAKLLAQVLSKQGKTLTGFIESLEIMEVAETGTAKSMQSLIDWVVANGSAVKTKTDLALVQDAGESIRGVLEQARAKLKEVCQVIKETIKALPSPSALPVRLSLDEAIKKVLEPVLRSLDMVKKMAKAFFHVNLLPGDLEMKFSALIKMIEKEEDTKKAAQLTKEALQMAAQIAAAGKTYCAKMQALAG